MQRSVWLSGFVLFALCVYAPLARAQTPDYTAPFTVQASPQYPQPFGTETLSFISGALDLTNATIRVVANGKELYAGTPKPVAVPLGAAGKPVLLSVTVTTASGKQTQSATVVPEDVSLVAEPQSSAPPLYAGKPLVPMNGSTRVVAVANFSDARGAAIAPSSLAYVWTIDDVRQDADSGIGKSALIVSSPLRYRSRTVTVTVTSRDGALVGGASLTLSPQDPSVLLYENDPLLGIRFDHALSGTRTLVSSEGSFYAAPFSFPLTNGAPLVLWYLNGSSAKSGSTVTLRPTGVGQGSASVSVVASVGSDVTANTSLSLIFGKKTSSLFGL